MKNIDDLLKKAKPAVPDLPNDFSQKIIYQIREQNLSITQQNKALSGISWLNLIAGILLLLFALILTNNAIFEVQMSGSLELLSFGSQYALDFATYLPLDMILPTLLIIAISSWLLWKSHMLKRGITLIAAGSLIVSSVGGSALAASNINEKIQSGIINHETTIPVISWFYKERARFHMSHPNVLMGKVIEQNDDSITIQDPLGKTQKVILPSGIRVKNGQIIRLDGKSIKNGFQANRMQHCSPTSAGKYFSHMEMMNSGMMKMNKNIMKHHKKMSCCQK